MENVLDYIKGLGVGCRHPHDPFLKEGNDVCQPVKPFGICDYDDENFYHKPYRTFSCHVPGCESVFETVIQFESHYNSCHTFTCQECKKNLPNYHLLDLHISETHDAFFAEMAKRKPMCYVEDCKEVFKNSEERHGHCVDFHKFPKNFRFDTFNKGKSKKDKSALKKHSKPGSQGQSSEEAMEVDSTKPRQGEVKFRGFTFGRGRGRGRGRPVFTNFSKDLLDSLPEQKQ